MPVDSNVACQLLPPHAASNAPAASALAVQLDQQRTACDAITFLDVHGANHGVVRGCERCFHFHRLQYDERLAGLDC